MAPRSASQPLLTAAAAVLVAGVLVAPLPFGAVAPEWRLALQAAAALALGLAAASGGRPPRRALGVAAAPAAVGAWGLLQSLPLPAGLVARLSPAAFALHAEAAALAGAEPPARMPIALAPDLARAFAPWWLAAAALVVAAAIVGRRRPARRGVAAAVAAAAILQLLYGAPRLGRQPVTIWGREVASPPNRLHGTFVNPDHLALLLAVALAVAGAWLARAATRREPGIEHRLLHLLPPAGLSLVLIGSLALTGSRGGLVAGALGFALPAVLSFGRSRGRLAGLAAAGLLAGGLALAAAGGALGGALARWQATSAWELTWNLRLQGWAAAWEQVRRFPLTGTGLAGFRETFRLDQPSRGEWWHLHNDWLELLVTTGAVGALLVLPALVALVGRLARVARDAARSEDRAAGLAGLAVALAVAVHSGVDFGLAVPANVWVVAVALGAACGTPLDGRVSRRPSDRPG